MKKNVHAKKQKKIQTRIMVFGTFDLLHPGHRHFFRQARRLARSPLLIVSVARDVNVRRIKGQLPLLSERRRARGVRQSGLADQVVLGGTRDHVSHIIKHRPDIIALGYDQTAYVKNLRRDLSRQGLAPRIVRLRPHKPQRYKSSLLKYQRLERRQKI